MHACLSTTHFDHEWRSKGELAMQSAPSLVLFRHVGLKDACEMEAADNSAEIMQKEIREAWKRA